MIAEVREKVTKQQPMLQVEFMQLLQDMIGDLTSAPEPVAIKLFAEDPALLRQWAPHVADTIKKIPGVVDILNGIDNTISGPAIDVSGGSGSTAARAGFTPQEVELDASAIMQGEPAPTPVVVNDRAYTIRVRFPEQTRVLRRADSEHAAGQFHRQDRHARLAGHRRRTAGADGDPPREPAAQCHA